ncbi:MAG: AzlD domain-containing protein [Parasporobacterium sp.]|nr:AzlD domain-containing protein [Parasporobacterium sp.]
MQISVYLYILVMAVVTYLVRAIPLLLARKEITNTFVRSFLYYMPYACLAAMTFPAILGATTYLISGIVGFIAAIIAAYFERSMITVALIACAAVFVTEQIIRWVM